MRKINCAPSSTNFKVENKYILKLKEIVRNFRQKNSFYSDHSKFATYADPEYLSIFKEELIEFSKAWIRLQQKNMSSEKEPGVEDHANSRLLHILDTAINASISSKEQLIKSKYSIPVSNFFKYNDKLSRLFKLTKLKLLSLDRITNSSLKKL